MKKINLVFMCFALALATLSCSSDDDGGVVNNPGILSIGETEIQLKAGAIQNSGSFDGLTIFDLTLLNSNIITVDVEPIPENNIVTLISFELITDSSQNLTEGEYGLFDFSDITSQTMASVAILENVDLSSETEIDEPPFFVEGSLQVISNGPQYEIEFSGVDNLGREISGNYKGTLTIIEE